MITKLEITGQRYEVSPKLHDYVVRKIGSLDRFMPRRSREAAHAEVILTEQKIKRRKEFVCEVVLYLPGDVITVKESTVNIYAAVDIVEAKLKNLLIKYKETHGSLRIHRRIVARLKRKA